MLVPCDNEILRCKLTQKAPYRLDKQQTLPIPIERELASLIYEGEVAMFRRCEELRKDLVRRHDFSTYACFRAIDELNEGEVNLDNLRSFLKRVGHYPTEDEVVAVIRRLDCNADSCVSYADLSEAIKPQEFSLINQYRSPS